MRKKSSNSNAKPKHVEKHDYFKDQNIQSVTDLHKLYPDQFDKIGNLPGEVQLHLNENVQLYIATPRKCSIHMLDNIKSKLGRMEQSGVIRKVTEHTDWISNVGFTERRDGSIRVCLDPRK